jgi:Ca2+-binding RTX toxin-like protein
MDGDAGIDMVNYSASSAGVNVDLLRASQMGGDAQGDVLANIERITGSNLADLLFGDGGANILNGLAGDDVLNGRGGADVLTGGPGNDRFVFVSATDANGDIITDWGAGDILDLSGIDANALLPGKQDFLLIGNRTFSQTAGELRFFNDGTNSFISGDVNGDGIADFTITVNGVHGFIAGVSPAFEQFHYAGADWC